MADLPTRTALFQVGRRSIITTPNLRINPRVVDTAGSDVNINLGAMSVLGEEVVAALASCMQGLFVETASADALDRVAFDRYQLTRQPATPATVDLLIARPAGATPAGTIPAGTRVQTVNGTQFALDADQVWGAGEVIKPATSPLPTATALIAGPAGNVPKNDPPGSGITQFVDQPFDATFTVGNPAGAAGGTDVESDPDFRSRILGFFPTIRRGTLGAIEFGARQVPGVAVAKAIEVTNPCGANALPACAVELIVADKNGGASSTMLQQVKDIMLQFRPVGIPVTVLGGTVQNQAVRWKIGITLGFNSDLIVAQIRAITVAIAQFLRPGQQLLESSLIAGARAVPGAIVLDDALQSPVGDVTPPNNFTLLRILPQEVTFV